MRSSDRWMPLGTVLVGTGGGLAIALWQQHDHFLRPAGYVALALLGVGSLMLIGGLVMPTGASTAEAVRTDVKIGGNVTITQKPSNEEVAAIAEKVFKEHTRQIQGAAAELAIARAEKMMAAYIAQLESQGPGALERPSPPTMEEALVAAQEEFAKSGDERLEQELVQDLIDQAAGKRRVFETPLVRTLLLGLAAFAISAVAALGFTLGHRGTTFAGFAKTASVGPVTIRYPTSWHREKPPHGLLLPQSISLTSEEQESLTIGFARGIYPGLLPSAFRQALPDRPRPVNVEIGKYQGVRYDRLKQAGFSKPLVVYVLLTKNQTILVACIRPESRHCAKILGTLVISVPTLDPRPSAALGRLLAPLLRRFGDDRRRLLEKLRAAGTAQQQARAAGQISVAYSRLRSRLSKAPCPPIAGPACGLILAATKRGETVYAELQRAAAKHSSTRYHAASAAAAKADIELQDALRNLRDLGYAPTLRHT